MKIYTYSLQESSCFLMTENDPVYRQDIIPSFFNTYNVNECKSYLLEMYSATLIRLQQSKGGGLTEKTIMDFTLQLMSLIEQFQTSCSPIPLSATTIQGNNSYLSNFAGEECVEYLKKPKQEENNKFHPYESAPCLSAEDIKRNKSSFMHYVRENAKKDEDLLRIVGMIHRSMDVEKIFLLGKYPLLPREAGEEYDLLVLIKNTQHKKMDEYESIIINRSTDMAPVYTSVFTIEKINELLRKGNPFFASCCRNENLIYDFGETPISGKEECQQTALLFIEEHNLLMNKAKHFFTGAQLYHQQVEYALATFMLHQSIEHSLNALLVPLLQYRIKTHNLHKLLRYARRFNNKIYQIFPRDTKSEVALFQILQKAYIHARYKNSFSVSYEQSDLLLLKTQNVIQNVESSFQQLVMECF